MHNQTKLWPCNPQNSVLLSWTWTWQSREIKSLYGILIDYEGVLRKGSPWRFWGGQSLCRSLVGGELSLSGRRVLWKVPFTATEFDWKDCETDASHRWARFFISLALQNSVFENEEIRKFRQFCAMFKITFTKSLSASYHLITNNLAMWSMSLILWVTFSWGFIISVSQSGCLSVKNLPSHHHIIVYPDLSSLSDWSDQKSFLSSLISWYKYI